MDNTESKSRKRPSRSKWPNPPKDFIWSAQFEEHGKAIEKELRRFDEIMEGVEWGIRQDPKKCALATNGKDGIRMIVSNDPDGNFRIVIFFKEFAKKIVFMDIVATPKE